MNTNETKLNVDGMTCPSCVHHVSSALKDVEGVVEVDVQRREGKVIVKHATGVELSNLISALRGAGYESREA